MKKKRAAKSASKRAAKPRSTAANKRAAVKPAARPARAARSETKPTRTRRPAAAVSSKAAPSRPKSSRIRHREAAVPAAELAPVAIQPEASGLSSEDVDRYRQMLLEKRALLVRDMRTMSDEALNRNRQESSGNLSSMPIHMADLGTDNYEQEFTLGLIESERALLRDIDEALQRIANGTYGVCAATGRAIGKARLNAQPWTKFSYEYVLALEKGGARRM